jgi:Type II secretory pathway, component PulF
MSEKEYLENEELKEQQYIDINELAEQLQQVNLNPIELPIDNLQEVIEYDKDDFIKGLKDISFICGQLTGLLNTGITKEDAVTILVNRDNILHAQKLQKMINENNIEVSKIQTIKIEQQVL